MVIAAIAGLCALGSGIEMLRRLGSKKLSRAISARSPVSAHEMYFHYYKQSGLPEDAISSARNTIARILRVDPDKIMPDDRLDELRGLPKWILACTPIEDAVDDLLFHLDLIEADSGVRCSDPRTINDLIIYLSKHESRLGVRVQS